jgi:pantoate--beta-alanine ligase
VPLPSSIPVDRTVATLRARLSEWRRTGDPVALVPTMGALHAGHLALVHEARKRGRVVVSIFVNPRQFAPNEDLKTYPRNETADLEKLDAHGVDVVFSPHVEEIYPPGFATSIDVAGPALGLEAATRPHFFGGVATVVAKLLIAAAPDSAVFGEKDYQQLLVVKRMVADLALPTEIVGCPTVREADGLALSSRNAYLSPVERPQAPLLYRALQQAAATIRAASSIVSVVAAAEGELTAGGFRVDYVAVRNAETLAEVADARREPMRVLAAAWLGKTRLIDNVAV